MNKLIQGIDKAVWDEAIIQGRSLAKRDSARKWALADIALRLCPLRDGSQRSKGSDGVQDILRLWLQECQLEDRPVEVATWRYTPPHGRLVVE